MLVREAGIGPTLGADDVAMKDTSTCTHGQALPGDATYALGERRMWMRPVRVLRREEWGGRRAGLASPSVLPLWTDDEEGRGEDASKESSSTEWSEGNVRCT